jgi:hypothetical protein
MKMEQDFKGTVARGVSIQEGRACAGNAGVKMQSFHGTVRGLILLEHSTGTGPTRKGSEGVGLG